jgi:hypothetical protein
MQEELLDSKTKRLVELVRWLIVDERLEEGQYLPMWVIGDHVGAGDWPRTYPLKGTAKVIARNQVKREGARARGFVGELRNGDVYVYEIGFWDGGEYKSDPDCWRNPLAQVPLVPKPEVLTVGPIGPRSRRSPLAERAGVAHVERLAA